MLAHPAVSDQHNFAGESAVPIPATCIQECVSTKGSHIVPCDDDVERRGRGDQISQSHLLLQSKDGSQIASATRVCAARCDHVAGIWLW
jgi:hypothetical protein